MIISNNGRGELSEASRPAYVQASSETIDPKLALEHFPSIGPAIAGLIQRSTIANWSTDLPDIDLKCTMADGAEHIIFRAIDHDTITLGYRPTNNANIRWLDDSAMVLEFREALGQRLVAQGRELTRRLDELTTESNATVRLLKSLRWLPCAAPDCEPRNWIAPVFQASHDMFDFWIGQAEMEMKRVAAPPPYPAPQNYSNGFVGQPVVDTNSYSSEMNSYRNGMAMYQANAAMRVQLGLPPATWTETRKGTRLLVSLSDEAVDKFRHFQFVAQIPKAESASYFLVKASTECLTGSFADLHSSLKFRYAIEKLFHDRLGSVRGLIKRLMTNNR